MTTMLGLTVEIQGIKPIPATTLTQTKEPATRPTKSAQPTQTNRGYDDANELNHDA